ncbi:16S rRNA (uracil(1498)-N(3))-methyltransferase [Lusitaniella coriacea]|uniref:16S rRNA (uracil(1498)-N(3))-methyltransferase n=1 Tax=Lusitaniella coriacea TaxID=1983105 RepID=UPI003CE8A78E
MQRFVISPQQKRAEQIQLTREQQHYLYRVLRLQRGDRAIALDGEGTAWIVQLQEDSAVIIESLNVQTELPIAVTLMAALPKGNTFDEVVRSVTELGVATILPVISDRALLKPSPQKIERWRRIAKEAAEQSERQIVPTLLDPVSFNDALHLTAETRDRYLCVARGNPQHLLASLQNFTSHSLVIAIGPEGGWTTPEVDRAIASGFQTVSLGKRVLRAATAPLAALSLIAAVLEN